MTTFAPGNRVPPGGLATWPSPDATQAPGPMLPANLPVMVTERWGEWARVTCSNGWEAWVDARLLLAGAERPSAAGLDESPLRVGSVAVSLPLLGVAAAAIGAVLSPWLQPPGAGGTRASKLPIKFLVDPNINSAGGPKILWLLILLIAAGAFLTVRPISRKLRKTCGWGLVLVATMFLTNVQRALSMAQQGGFQAGSVFANLGFGVYLTAIGGLLIALGRGQET